METRFIGGNEYVDRKSYIKARDENSQLHERIVGLQAEVERLRKDVDEAREVATMAHYGRNKDGYTYADFQHVWLTQARDRAAKLESRLTRLEEIIGDNCEVDWCGKSGPDSKCPYCEAMALIKEARGE